MADCIWELLTRGVDLFAVTMYALPATTRRAHIINEKATSFDTRKEKKEDFSSRKPLHELY